MSSEAEAIAATTRPATVQSLTSDLRALGLADGQTVMVHASLSALGFVVGGAQAVVTALLEVVGPSGTLMMPTHSGALSDPSLWEAPPVPEAWWDTIRTNMPAYDSALTPTREMGAIVECFRHVEGVQRSGHPAVSAAAVGPNAARLVGDHSLDDGLGEGSPQARLYELDGLVLLLGVSHANNTSLHLAEYRSAAPNAARITEHAPMLIAGEHHWRAFSSLDTDEDDFAELGEAFASSGAETRAPVAAGTGRLMSARAVVDFGVEWMTVNRVRPADQSSPLMPDTVDVNDKSTAAWTSRQLSGAVGVELMGLDVRTLDDTDFARFRHALVEHHVVVVRDQSLTPSEQIDFGRRFGELDTHPFVDGSPAHPEVIDIVTEADDRANFGGGWHTDVTFLEKPDLGSILYAVELPAFGGDTLFASQHAAYDALSDLMKNMLDGLTATHSAGRQYGEGGQSTKSKAISTKNTERAAQLVEHPVVRTHPESGRKGLYVNPAFTVKIRGMRPAESDALLEFLYAHAVREAFTCRVQWQPGTLVMWDNRSVQHHALHDYAGQRRHVRRITVQGDRPV